MKNKKKVLFLGTRVETLILTKLFFNVVKIVTTKNSHIKKNNYKCTIINKKNKELILKKLIKCKGEILISAGFPYLIPLNLINKFKLALNCHPGKFPKYKGYYSIDDAIKNNETNIYYTIHHLNEEFDSGRKIFETKINRKNLKKNDLKNVLFSTVEPFALFQALKKLKEI